MWLIDGYKHCFIQYNSEAIGLGNDSDEMRIPSNYMIEYTPYKVSMILFINQAGRIVLISFGRNIVTIVTIL